MAGDRDVGVVLSGGGINGVLMELGFLQRLRESTLWPRISVIFGTSSGALSGAIAALDRLDDLEEFLLALQPEQTFRPNRLWRLPFLGLHEYALPRTIESWFGDLEDVARALAGRARRARNRPERRPRAAGERLRARLRGADDAAGDPGACRARVGGSAGARAPARGRRPRRHRRLVGAQFPARPRVRPRRRGADRGVPLPAAVPADGRRRASAVPA